MLHIIPFGALDAGVRLNLPTRLEGELYYPMNVLNVASGIVPRINFDGFLAYAKRGWQNTPYSYLQVFRNGILEAVDSILIPGGNDSEIDHARLEGVVLDGVGRYLAVQKSLGIEPPLCIMLTLIGVKDSRLFAHRVGGPVASEPIDRNILQIPEVVLHTFECEPDVIMRPIFDAIGNAGGWPGSQSYNDQGRWAGNR